MFYVIDEGNLYIHRFNTREDAEAFCERWNTAFRFSFCGEPKAHIMVGE